MKSIRPLLLAGLLALSFPVFSQNFSDAEHRADCHTQWMTKELNLSSAQEKSVKEINRHTVRALEEAKFKEETQEKLRDRAKELDTERDAKLENILRPGQVLRYVKRKENAPALASACILSERPKVGTEKDETPTTDKKLMK